MKHVLILGSKDSGGKNDPNVFAAKLRATGLSATVAYWEDLLFDISTGSVSICTDTGELKDLGVELVIALNWYKTGKHSYFKDIAYSVALYLNHHNVEFWNSEMLAQRSVTKLSCMIELALQGISVPRTLYGMNADLLYNKCLPLLPLVVKSFAASRGNSNYLAKSTEELEFILKGQDNTFLVQPYLENDHDLRVICVDGKPAMILRRSRDKEAQTHLNNTSQGGSAEWLQIDQLEPELLTESSKICIITKRELAGIDFIPDASAKCGYSCLEVNAIPQLTSGVDVDKKLETIAARISDKQRSDR